jgi:Ca-activated chloride channel family protein
VNPFVMAARDRFSTFALEADTASYTLTRRFIRKGYRPPPAVVRMEEFINAFDYHYPTQSEQVFTVYPEAAPAPFGSGLTLLKVGVKGKVLGRDGRKPSHLVFVLDTSGSMGREDRLPLVQYALGELLGQLGPQDRISLVTYDLQARLRLEAVPATEAARIRSTVATLECGAATHLLAGVQLGYQVAQRHFRAGEINRLILCSDGVANVGPDTAASMLAQVAALRKQGITITSVGVGQGAYDDDLLEQLANKGDGNYVYLDSREEARRVFVEQLSATLQNIARDVKIQVEFDPRRVRRYRLIGYENRAIADEDFRYDAVDAGEIGSGQSATALYELELLPQSVDEDPIDLGTVHIRYKAVDSDRVHEFPTRLPSDLVRPRPPETAPHFALAAGVAEFAELLRESEHAGDGSLPQLEQYLIRVANQLPLDPQVQGLVDLVRAAQGLPVAGR